VLFPVREVGDAMGPVWKLLFSPSPCTQAACREPSILRVDLVEAGRPNTLLRRGFTKQSLLPGTVITVDGCQSKDRTNRANGRDMTLPDGTKLFMGSSGTGAPRDGKDPTEPKKPKQEPLSR
jgi:hypothetical protein